MSEMETRSASHDYPRCLRCTRKATHGALCAKCAAKEQERGRDR